MLYNTPELIRSDRVPDAIVREPTLLCRPNCLTLQYLKPKTLNSKPISLSALTTITVMIIMIIAIINILIVVIVIIVITTN